jgi:predicted amidohydrolase
MLDSILQTLGRSLQRKAKPAAIRQYLERKGMQRTTNLDQVDPHDIRVAVVQEQIRVLKTIRAFADRMYSFVAQAAEQGVQLVCFPEENGLLLLGQTPFIDLILKFATPQMAGSEVSQSPAADPPRIWRVEVDPNSPLWQLSGQAPGASGPSAQTGGLSVLHLISFFTPFLKDAFETTFSELARGFGIYVMAGSVMLVEDGRLYNRAYLFGPQGEIVGTQDKAHPIVLEIDMDLSCATELKVFETRLGRLAFPVCMDATYFETFKILKQMGAQIIIIPIFNTEEYHYYFSLRGIWPRVQESGVYGLKSALVGNLYALKSTGPAGIYAPLGLTSDRSGVLAEAGTVDGDALLTASLDLTRLETYHSAYFSDTNPALYRKYFPKIYEGSQ